MPKLNYDPINTYVLTDVLRPFYKKRIEALTELKLITGNKAILSRKNPYLFKAKNILTAEEFVRSALDAHLSSQEETYFGNLMEGLAVFVCGLAFKGQKPEAGAAVRDAGPTWPPRPLQDQLRRAWPPLRRSCVVWVKGP
jgi:hypothetical protein